MKNIFLILLMSITSGAFAQKTNFSGTWEINKDKTNFAEARAAVWVVPRQIKIDQQSAQLTLTRVSTDNQLQDQPAITEVLAFNGKPFERTYGDTKVTTILNWKDDQAISIQRKGASTAKETWTLEDNGKSLVIDRDVETLQGNYHVKCYYDKK